MQTLEIHKTGAIMKEGILTAYKEGNLLQAIFEQSIDRNNNLDDFIKELVNLHNENLIDIIATFKELKNDKNTKYDYWLTRQVLEKSLPKLNAPILSVMECVTLLLYEAGQDLAAELILPPFTDFCATSEHRSKEALRLIEQNIDKFVALFAPTIVAGTQIDFIYFFNEALRFIEHEDIKLRQIAVFTLRRISYPSEQNIHEKAINALQKVVNKESDDVILGNAIRAAFNLYKVDNAQFNRVVKIIELSLSKGGDFALDSASGLLSFELEQIPESLLDILLLNLQDVKPEHEGTLDRIDMGLAKLLKKDAEKVIDFLTKLLLKNVQDLSLNIFDSVIREFYKNENGILNKLLTKWFCHGAKVLCDGISSIVDSESNDNLLLEVDISEIEPKNNSIHLIFLARKTIGYLFTKPITTSSMILSLIEYTKDEEVRHELENLLFNSLLINHPGKVRDHLKSQLQQNKSKELLSSIQSVLQSLEDYFNELKSVGIIPELNPPQSHRDAYRRHFSEIIRKSMKDGEKKSVLLSLFSEYVLLYGRKFINYSYVNNGPPIRQENPLKSFGTTMEFPRISIIAPFDYSYMLKIFRAEQLKK